MPPLNAGARNYDMPNEVSYRVSIHASALTSLQTHPLALRNI
jgi:hypothetical protein